MDLSENYTLKTDMADEIAEGLSGKKGVYGDGVSFCGRSENGIRVDKMTVERDISFENNFKPHGKYATITLERDVSSDKSFFEAAAEAISREIRELLPKEKGLCLVACLGNRGLVADALGPLAAEKIIASRHIKSMNPELFSATKLGNCACISTGVAGDTGVQAAEIILGAVKILKPKSVIVIDALASGRLCRLMKTVQISDAGISPGSGVNNACNEISFSSLGVPVIALGVPTVIEALTVCRDLLSGKKDGGAADFEGTGKNNFFDDGTSDFFVTVKDADVRVKTMARLVGYGVNRAIHPYLGFSEMEELLS